MQKNQSLSIKKPQKTNHKKTPEQKLTTILTESKPVRLERRNSLKFSLKNAILEWCEESTVHALPNAARSKTKIHQIIYICFLLASTGYCIYSVAVTTSSYLNYDSITSMQIINETPTFFPAISFCSMKMLNKVAAKNYLQTILFNYSLNHRQPVYIRNFKTYS